MLYQGLVFWTEKQEPELRGVQRVLQARDDLFQSALRSTSRTSAAGC